MSEAISEERLNDYVDGVLSDQAVAEVERYLAASAEARDTVKFLRSLQAQAAELPCGMRRGSLGLPSTDDARAPREDPGATGKGGQGPGLDAARPRDRLRR